MAKLVSDNTSTEVDTQANYVTPILRLIADSFRAPTVAVRFARLVALSERSNHYLNVRRRRRRHHRSELYWQRQLRIRPNQEAFFDSPVQFRYPSMVRRWDHVAIQHYDRDYTCRPRTLGIVSRF